MVSHDLRDAGDDVTFDFGIRLGLVFITQAAFLSAIAVLSLLSYLAYSILQVRRCTPSHMLRTSHIQWYFISLMVSELIQALGGILNIEWVRDAAVTEGTYCTAQGALKQIGDVGVALASLAIALHTFMVIVFRWRPPKSSTLPIIVISTIWVFLALIIGLSFATHKGKTYYGDTKYWCWITKDYLAEGIALEYVWMWTAALLNIALYIPITLVLKGLITVDGFHVHFHGSKERYHASISSKPTIVDRIATKMLAYPALYTCTVLPIAIVRWAQFYNHAVPWPATVFADVIFSSSGLLNVLLYTITRPTLIPHREHESFSTNTIRMEYPTASFNSILSPHHLAHAQPINSIALTSVVPVDPSSPSTLAPKTPAELMEPIKLRVLTSSPVHSFESSGPRTC